MKTGKKHTIKNKVAGLVLSVSLTSVVLLGLACGAGIVSVRQNTVSSLQTLNDQTVQDSTETLREQTRKELRMLAENKSSQADTSLSLILNQTRLVAMAAEDIYSHEAQYLQGRPDASLPIDTFDFSCNYPEEMLGRFSFHLRAPRSLLDPGSIVEENGVVVKAELDGSSLTGVMRRELYLAGYLEGVLGGIRNFDNGDGTYNGIGASYFCLESSGIDILADTLTTSMVEYDARESTWYQEASKLKAGEVYWSNPVQDGSGRGEALICAMPVYVDGDLVGVAGSGGLIDNIREMVQSTTLGNSGYAFLLNTSEEGRMNVIASANPDRESEISRYQDNLLESGNTELISMLEKAGRKESGMELVTLDGQLSYVAFSPLSITEWTMVTVMQLNDTSIVAPIETLQENINQITQRTMQDMNGNITMIVAIFVGIALAVTALVIYLSYKFSNRLAYPLLILTDGVRRVSGGDLDFQIHVESDDETAELGEAFNHMTSSLKEYIKNLSRVTAEKERIGAELHVATQIQASMLPCIFPPFPERNEFDIYASMTPAKEVGGDFYDFFLTDDDHLAIVIADVSGKGVPAALFMVVAKILLKNRAQMGASPKEILETVNNQLCEGNTAEMFVTAWLGVYEISTGKLTAANAGHEYPAIKRAGGRFELFRDTHGFVLAGMENVHYREYELELHAGDMLFVYTDGVTEATDVNNALYGTERMLEALNSQPDTIPEELLHQVKADIDFFVGDAPQFDDITMLCLKCEKPVEKPSDDAGH